ncbi:MAG TPA: amino acid ABC transporter permease, partial [Hyphomicrobiaceae bacterium]|nr:amino acid ABC transporter permease [Hyphomicrobiaceae bacterium]
MSYHWNWGILFQPSPEGQGTYLDMLLWGLAWTVTTG